ncbi:MAG TPA: HD domain-containing phosphohydrolase [Pirellulales bacterium]|nr:HD domain-containing phosphohydrolase [Pirellulales bacterium]
MADKLQFVPVALDSLRPNTALEFDLYLRSDPRQPVVLFREQNYPLEERDVRSLSESGIDSLYISAQQAESFERYVRETVIGDETIPVSDRYKILRDVSRASFLGAFNSDCPDRMVEQAQSLAGELVELICDDDLIVADLFRVMQHDYCTYTHLTNVCAYGTALAAAVGIADRTALAAIAAGALLHDIGKRKVPQVILNKPGTLTAEETKIVRRHPQDGFDELARRGDLGWGQLMMVYQHHERPDGRGYPVGIELDEIHPWAQICTVVDVFDALTCHRPYRRPMPAREALAYLERNAGRQFNPELVQCWIEAMSRRS